MKRIIIILAIIIGFASTANAQYTSKATTQQILTINYQIGIPIGQSRDFVPSVAYQGININWGYCLTPNWVIGFDFSYNTSHKKYAQEIYRPDDYIAVNAAQYRYTQVFPLKAQAKYIFTPNQYVKAYAAIGIGALCQGNHIIIQDMDIWKNDWGFLVSPEIGMLVPFGDLWGMNATFGYNYSTNDVHFGKIDISGRNELYFNVGVYLNFLNGGN